MIAPWPGLPRFLRPDDGRCRYCASRAKTWMLEVDSRSVDNFCFRCVHDALASGWRRLEGGAT